MHTVPARTPTWLPRRLAGCRSDLDRACYIQPELSNQLLEPSGQTCELAGAACHVFDGTSDLLAGLPDLAGCLRQTAGTRLVVEQHAPEGLADDTEESDLDLLVDPSPVTSLMDLAALQVEAEALLGMRVDVVTPRFLPSRFRERVLREAAAV